MREDMRAKLSIFELLLRNGGGKIAAAILLTMLAEGFLLYNMMQNETMYYENLFARGAAIPLKAGFVLLALGMCNSMKASKSNLSYTLRRLKTEPKELFYAETIINILAFVAFWALAVALLCGFGAYFTENISEALNKEVGLFLAFSRSHDLKFWLPAGNISLVIRNVIGVAALGAAIARLNCFLRKGKRKPVAALLTLYLFTRGFYADLNTSPSNFILAAAMLVILVFCVLSAVSEEEGAAV